MHACFCFLTYLIREQRRRGSRQCDKDIKQFKKRRRRQLSLFFEVINVHRRYEEVIFRQNSINSTMRQNYDYSVSSTTAGTMARFRVPENRTITVRVAMEVCAILLLVYPMIHIYIILQGDMEPVQRGFFCNDETIKYPNVPEEISVGEAFVIWALIVILLVPGVEILHITISYDTYSQQRVCNIPWIIIELYRILGYCLLGGLCTLLTTEMAKYKIGRHRPYFLSVCNITLDDALCKDGDYYKLVNVFKCSGDPAEVHEASKSFMSGHSSFSFYCATFLILYLHARLNNLSLQADDTSSTKLMLVFKGLKILRPFLQFGIFSLAFYVSLTRITNYKHHPGDVVTGIFVGSFFAIIIFKFILDLFKRPRTFKIDDNFETDFDEYDGHLSRRDAESGEITHMKTFHTSSEANHEIRVKSDQVSPADPDKLLHSPNETRSYGPNRKRRGNLQP